MVNLTLEDMGALYRETRLRISDLVTEIGTDVATSVPACPEWTVKDVIAHLTGVCEDILAGNLAGAASDPWTAAQVERARDVPLSTMIERWDTAASQVEPLTPMFPDRSANQWVADVTCHEHDLRTALDRPGARDSASVEVAVDFLADAFLRAARDRPMPPLELIAEDRTWTTEGAQPGARLSASKFELMRALSGRRSPDQIRKLDWTGDPDVFLPAFEWGPFRPCSDNLLE